MYTFNVGYSISSAYIYEQHRR